MRKKVVKIERPEGFVKKERGNPKWGHMMLHRAPVLLTRWELMLKSLHLTEQDVVAITNSPTVRQFVTKHKNNSYIPEWVLKAMGCVVELKDGDYEIYFRKQNTSK